MSTDRLPLMQLIIKIIQASLDVIATMSVIGVSLIVARTLLVSSSPSIARANAVKTELPKTPISVTGAPTEGNLHAKVVILEYSDFQCPYCGKFVNDVLPNLQKEYIDPGKVLLVFRNFPLEKLHPLAMQAAEAAQCAGLDGKFWEMHNRLYADQTKLDLNDLLDDATGIGLRKNDISSCLSTAGDSVKRDMATGIALNVTGTPTFFIGLLRDDGLVDVADRLNGAQPATRFREVLNPLLKKSGST